MADGYSRPAFCRHIAAHGHRISRVDEPGHHIIPIHKGPVRGIVPLLAASDVPLFIQPEMGIRLIAGQFPIGIHIVAADGIQNLGLVADGRRMIPFRHIVHAHCSSAAGVIGLAGPILAVIGGYIVIDFHSLAVVFIRAVIAPFGIFGPDIIFIIHVLARCQLIDFHLFVIIGIGVGVVDFDRDPFRIQLLIGIGFVPADGFLGLRRMGEFADAIPGAQRHIFRLLIRPCIAGLGILLDGRDLVVLPHDQVALRIIGGIGIRSLGRSSVLGFDIHRLVSRSIAGISGSGRSQGDRRESQPQGQGQAVDFLRYGIPAGMFLPMIPCDFRHDYITVFDFAPDDFIDFIHYGFLSFENLVFLKMAWKKGSVHKKKKPGTELLLHQVPIKRSTPSPRTLFPSPLRIFSKANR